MTKKVKKQLDFGPIISLVITFIIILILSFVFAKLNLTTTKSEIVNGVITTTNISVKNILSVDGIKYIFSSVLKNFQDYKVLLLFIISILGIGFVDNVGLFKTAFQNLKKLKLSFLIFTTLILGCLIGKLGVYSYAFLLPLAACVYKNLNKNPIIGLITMFIALTVGSAATVFPTYSTEYLGKITEISAVSTVDKAYVFGSSSEIYITIASFILIAFVGKFIIEKYLINKLPKVRYDEVEELEFKHNGLKASNITFLIIFALLLYAVIPGLPLSGILLGEGTSYLEKLLGPSSPFGESYVLIFNLILIICGTVFGIKSKKIKNYENFTRMFMGSLSGTAIVFGIMIILSLIINVINWTGIDVFLISILINLLSTLKITGFGLILIYFIFIVLISIILPGGSKWQMIAPVAVPLIMRANLSPSYAQFIYSAANGIGSGLSFLFPYTAIIFGLIYKYSENGNFGYVKLYKMLSPIFILFTIVWIIIIITWYVVGIPMGVGVLPSL